MLFFNLTMCQGEGNTKQCNKRLERDFFFKENETTSRHNPRPENYQEHTLCSTGTYCTPRS